MINYYKYLPISFEDESWGMYVLNAGCNRINPDETYPSKTHPIHHYFDWNRGRMLDEFQIIYIANGEGYFESASCKDITVKEGMILLLFPGEWHRFKPNEKTGWDEFWVGFNGTIIKNLQQQNFVIPDNPAINVGMNDKIIQLFTDIIEKTREEKTGYQPLVSGIVMHLLGQIYSLTKQQSFDVTDITETIINKARIILRTNIDENIAMEKIAEELNVSYAWFRKAFKAYTGIAPNQYLLQLKIEKAKMLISDHSKSIKEIAFSLKFESAFYFSKLFKEKTGFSPEQYRKNMER